MGVNLRLLKALSGEKFYHRVCFITTMWNTIPGHLRTTCEDREHQLRESTKYWGEMINFGSRVFRYNISEASEIAILKSFTSPRGVIPTPRLMEQLAANTPYQDTDMGKIMAEVYEKREKKRIMELEEERQEAQEETQNLIEAQRRLGPTREEGQKHTAGDLLLIVLQAVAGVFSHRIQRRDRNGGRELRR